MNKIHNTLVASAIAGLALFAGACGSEAPAAAPAAPIVPQSNAETVRLALTATGNPWKTMTDTKIDGAGQAVCDAVKTNGPDSIRSTARIVADNPPAASEGLPTLSYQQAYDLQQSLVSVYCPTA